VDFLKIFFEKVISKGSLFEPFSRKEKGWDEVEPKEYFVACYF